MDMRVNIAGVELEESGNGGFRNLWIRRRIY